MSINHILSNNSSKINFQKDLHESTQKRAFTKFINEKLTNLIEFDLFEEIKDGIKLIELIEILSGKKIKSINRLKLARKDRIHCIDNVNIVLDYLIKRKVRYTLYE